MSSLLERRVWLALRPVRPLWWDRRWPCRAARRHFRRAAGDRRSTGARRAQRPRPVTSPCASRAEASAPPGCSISDRGHVVPHSRGRCRPVTTHIAGAEGIGRHGVHLHIHGAAHFDAMEGPGALQLGAAAASGIPARDAGDEPRRRRPRRAPCRGLRPPPIRGRPCPARRSSSERRRMDAERAGLGDVEIAGLLGIRIARAAESPRRRRARWWRPPWRGSRSPARRCGTSRRVPLPHRPRRRRDCRRRPRRRRPRAPAATTEC